MYYLLAEKIKYYPSNDVIEIDKKPKKLEPQVSQLLQLFLQNPQQVCSKEFILEKVWQGRVVTDDSVRVVIRKLRDDLTDNAKAPLFIKTIPGNGYQLICDIRHVTDNSVQKHLTDLRFISAVILLCILAISGYLLYSHELENSLELKHNRDITDVRTQNDIDFRLTELTRLPGSEVSPDYDTNSQRLIFSYRESQDDLMSLYVKDLQTETIQKLTHDDYNYTNAHWIKRGKGLVYTRFIGEQSQHFRANYHPDSGLSSIESLPPELNSWFLKSVGFAGQLVLSSNTTPRSLALWHPATMQLKQITAPASGEGDVYGEVSLDGTRLAVIRALDSQQRQLLVIDLKTGSVLIQQTLSFMAYQLIWQDNDNGLLIGDFFGKLQHFDMLSNEVSNTDLSQYHINNVFFDCGAHCFFARQHNGNYLDVSEQPNPYFYVSNQPMISISSLGIEDFPVYGNSGVVYFAQRQKGETWLMKKESGKKPENLYLFPNDGQLQALTINDDASYLAGKLGLRIFYFDLKTLGFQWLSSELADDFFPHFSQQGDIIHFSSMPNGILQSNQFDLTTEKLIATSNDKQWRYSFDQASTNLNIYIDAQNQLWMEHESKQKQLLLTLPSSSPNRFKLVKDWLYFIERIGNNAYLSRLSLRTFEVEQSELAKNRLRLNFDISADGTRLLGVNSVLAQSNLVKVKLHLSD